MLNLYTRPSPSNISDSLWVHSSKTRLACYFTKIKIYQKSLIPGQGMKHVIIMLFCTVQPKTFREVCTSLWALFIGNNENDDFVHNLVRSLQVSGVDAAISENQTGFNCQRTFPEPKMTVFSRKAYSLATA